LFTREQVEQIIEETSRKLNLDRSSEGSKSLPNEIFEGLENSSTISKQMPCSFSGLLVILKLKGLVSLRVTLIFKIFGCKLEH
jgi:hypothetical protein